MATKLLELRFPAGGVNRRLGYRDAADAGPPYRTPWAVNMRLEDSIARRLRGGSRPGLTKFLASAVGETVADMKAIQIASSIGTEEVLVVLVDETLGVVSGGTFTTPVAALKDESGNYIVTEAGARILLSTANAPASAFLVAGKQHVYAVADSGIVRMDPKTGAVSNLVATKGTVPTGCTVGAVYRDRLWLGGYDNGVYASRQGDYADWNFGVNAEDSGRAIPFQLSEAAEVGDRCTALVPHRDAAMLAATARSLWAVRGDPGANGSLQRVSANVGVVTKRAWCKAEDAILFLGQDGLYQVAADGSGLAGLSEDLLPQELRDIDTSSATVLMGYDHDARGVHLYLPTSAGGDTHWFFDLAAKKFWPVELQDDHAPVAVAEYGGDLLLAGSDGYIRSIGGDNDDGTLIESHVLLGPVRLSGVNDFGLILNMHGMVVTGSGAVNWRLVTGDTAEQAADNGKAAIEAFQAGTPYASYVKASGVWSAGRSLTAYPRVRAMWACLWLQSTAKWAYESVSMETTPCGRWR